MKHTFIKSKMMKARPLLQDRSLARHVPATKWYDATTLRTMLDRYRVVYIKPDTGTGGTGIIRIKRLHSSKCLVSFKGKSKEYLNKNIFSEVKKRMRPDRKYIIQQGISLATCQNKPFDLRVVLQKPFDRWLLTWMSAKIAPNRDSIVTNVDKGGRDALIKKVLQGVDQPLNASETMDKLTRVSYKIANKLGAHFPLRIIGLDMGIDKKGKIWFIEANTKPNFHGLEKLDPVQYRRYRSIQKIINARY